MRELSLHLLDIAENSIAAGARNITIEIDESTKTDLLKLIVQDDGCGMSEEMVKKVIDPFITSRTTRKVGLGIPLLKEAAEACNGSFTLTSEVGKGTIMEVSFQKSHIDRMPLGDVASTFLNLLVSSPVVHWNFIYKNDKAVFELDDKEIKSTLGDVSLTEPDVLAIIREMFESGIAEIQK